MFNSKKDGFATLPSTAPKKLAIRVVVLHPHKGWQIISSNRFTQVMNGDLRLEEFAGRTIIVATAYLELDDRVTRLVRLGRNELYFDRTGLFDDEAMTARAKEVLQQEISAEEDRHLFSEDEAKEICRVLGCELAIVSAAR